ncbi:hypothetical protein ACLKA6_008539 [Drosophila palustris]
MVRRNCQPDNNNRLRQLLQQQQLQQQQHQQRRRIHPAELLNKFLFNRHCTLLLNVSCIPPNATVTMESIKIIRRQRSNIYILLQPTPKGLEQQLSNLKSIMVNWQPASQFNNSLYWQ